MGFRGWTALLVGLAQQVLSAPLDEGGDLFKVALAKLVDVCDAVSVPPLPTKFSAYMCRPTDLRDSTEQTEKAQLLRCVECSRLCVMAIL